MVKSLCKIISLTLSLSVILNFIFCSGAVSAETATAISTKEGFYNIRNNLNGNYYLTCDIEFSDSDFALGGSFYNSGKCFISIGNGKTPFTGTFDGRGYTVSGIKTAVMGAVYSIEVTPINTGIATLSDGWTGDYEAPTTPRPSISPVAGVFGSNTGTIKNLKVTNSTFSVRSNNSATLYLGGVVGHNNGEILNCSVNNTLNSDQNTYVGGIVGYQSGGSIKNCSVYGQIKSYGVFGGVAGAIAGGTVTDCFTDVAFTSESAANFGMVGIDVIDNIENCFYVSDEALNGVGSRISTAKAKDPKQYSNFDFDNTWYMSGVLRRPALKITNIAGQRDITAGDLNGDKKVNLFDLVSIAQYTAGWNVNIHSEVANVDNSFTDDGEDIINAQDVVYLARYLTGWNNAKLY